MPLHALCADHAGWAVDVPHVWPLGGVRGSRGSFLQSSAFASVNHGQDGHVQHGGDHDKAADGQSAREDAEAEDTPEGGGAAQDADAQQSKDDEAEDASAEDPQAAAAAAAGAGGKPADDCTTNPSRGCSCPERYRCMTKQTGDDGKETFTFGCPVPDMQPDLAYPQKYDLAEASYNKALCKQYFGSEDACQCVPSAAYAAEKATETVSLPGGGDVEVAVRYPLLELTDELKRALITGGPMSRPPKKMFLPKDEWVKAWNGPKNVHGNLQAVMSDMHKDVIQTTKRLDKWESMFANSCPPCPCASDAAGGTPGGASGGASAKHAGHAAHHGSHDKGHDESADKAADAKAADSKPEGEADKDAGKHHDGHSGADKDAKPEGEADKDAAKPAGGEDKVADPAAKDEDLKHDAASWKHMSEGERQQMMEKSVAEVQMIGNKYKTFQNICKQMQETEMKLVSPEDMEKHPAINCYLDENEKLVLIQMWKELGDVTAKIAKASMVDPAAAAPLLAMSQGGCRIDSRVRAPRRRTAGRQELLARFI